MERINIKSDFVQIKTLDFAYFGGTLDLLQMLPDLGDFSKAQSSGFFSVTDLLLYEFAKFSKTKGTRGDLNMDFETYSKFLRNYIDSRPYRYFGFFSLKAIEDYIQRLADRRRIKIDSFLGENFISQKLFIDFIDRALEADHPLILEMGPRQDFDYPKYSIILGREEDSLYLSSRGQEKIEKISNIFSHSDNRLGLLYIEAHL